MKLYVNVPRYKRNACSEAPGHVKEARRKPHPASILNRVEERWKKKKGKEVWKSNTRKQSYAEVVRSSPKEKWNEPVVETKQHVLPWMVNSIVGHMYHDLTFNQLCEEFFKKGMGMVRVRYLGDNLALLTPLEGDRMEELIRLNKDWFDRFFEIINPRSKSFVVGHKIVWARSYGLPISLWSKDYFAKVVGDVASLVAIDETTEAWDLEYARIQVRLHKSVSARIFKYYRIND